MTLTSIYPHALKPMPLCNLKSARMEIDMAIWRLTPVDLDDPSWEASSHRGYAIIRAENEDAAREIAQQAFGVKTGF